MPPDPGAAAFWQRQKSWSRGRHGGERTTPAAARKGGEDDWTYSGRGTVFDQQLQRTFSAADEGRERHVANPQPVPTVGARHRHRHYSRRFVAIAASHASESRAICTSGSKRVRAHPGAIAATRCRQTGSSTTAGLRREALRSRSAGRESPDAVVDDLGNPGGIGANHGDSCRIGLEDDAPEPFIQ